MDADDYYWKKTTPPFQDKIPLAKRNEHLKTDFNQHTNVVVSGSLVSWGKEWETAFDLAVFIHLQNTERMQRLTKRENQRYGEKLLTDKKIQQNSKAFLAWANQYENPDFNGRSLKVHNNWIKLLNCKVLRIDGAIPLAKKVAIITREINTGSN